MPRNLIRPIALVVLFFFGLPGISAATPTQFSNLFALGDSLQDTGNLFIATGNPPLSTSFPQPLPQDPPYFSGRFSNGPVYAEHLWTGLGLPGSLTPSIAGGTNFSVGGARSRYHQLDLNNPLNPTFDPVTNSSSLLPGFSLLGQRDALLGATGGTLDSSALYSVWSGSNDVSDAFSARTSGAPVSYSNALLQQASSDFIDVITDLVAAGASTLLVPNVPDLGLVPEVQAIGSPALEALATSLAQQYNDLVDIGLANIEAKIIRLNTFQFLRDLVQDPAMFNFPANANVTEACFDGFVGVPGTVCATPDTYVFWDKIHPSASTHTVLGQLALAAIPESSVVLLTAIGITGLGFARRRRQA